MYDKLYGAMVIIIILIQGREHLQTASPVSRVSIVKHLAWRCQQVCAVKDGTVSEGPGQINQLITAILQLMIRAFAHHQHQVENVCQENTVPKDPQLPSTVLQVTYFLWFHLYLVAYFELGALIQHLNQGSLWKKRKNVFKSLSGIPYCLCLYGSS